MEKIMALKRDILLKKYFQGFIDKNVMDYEKIILNNSVFMNRFDIEENHRFKQPIPYAVIINRNFGKFFIYRRSSKCKDYPEKRLYGKWSIGVGGHVNANSVKGNPILNTLKVEIEEEIDINEKMKPELFGYINDDGDSVGRHHFGIVYLINMKSDKIGIKSPELIEGKMISLQDFEKIPKQEIERWSLFVYEKIKNIL